MVSKYRDILEPPAASQHATPPANSIPAAVNGSALNNEHRTRKFWNLYLRRHLEIPVRAHYGVKCVV